YDDEIPLYHRFGPYFDVSDDVEGSIIIGYAEDDVLMSGLARTGSRMAGDPAVLSIPTGDGHLVLFGFTPLHRLQTPGNFGLVWNAILNWNDLGVGLADAEEAETVAAGH